MDRRTLFAGVGAAVAASVGDATATGEPVLLYDESVGFAPPGYAEMDPPELVVYQDGSAIADARYTARLGGDTLAALVRSTTRVLRDPANLRLRPGLPMVADLPDSRFVARSTGQSYERSVYALVFYRGDHGYPAALYRLLDTLTAWQRWITGQGRPYRADAVRLVALRLDQPATGVPAWPADVPVPILDQDASYAAVDWYGPAARAVAAGLPHGPATDWSEYRGPDGKVLSVAWRRLLPHERHRAGTAG